MEARENSGLNMEEDRDRVGVIVSSGGGFKNLKIIRMHERGETNVYPKALSTCS